MSWLLLFLLHCSLTWCFSLIIMFLMHCDRQKTICSLAVKQPIPSECLSRLEGWSNIKPAFRKLMKCWGGNQTVDSGGLTLGESKYVKLVFSLLEGADILGFYASLLEREQVYYKDSLIPGRGRLGTLQLLHICGLKPTFQKAGDWLWTVKAVEVWQKLNKSRGST